MSTEKRNYKPLTLVCVECGATYLAKTHKSKYCGSSCKNIHLKKKNLKYPTQQPDRNKLQQLEHDHKLLRKAKSKLSEELFYLKKDFEALAKKNQELETENNESQLKINKLLDMNERLVAKIAVHGID